MTGRPLVAGELGREKIAEALSLTYEPREPHGFYADGMRERQCEPEASCAESVPRYSSLPDGTPRPHRHGARVTCHPQIARRNR